METGVENGGEDANKEDLIFVFHGIGELQLDVDFEIKYSSPFQIAPNENNITRYSK